ncbi:hypothetical protein [Agrobacterium vitis]|uniref:hypothetical protein n=1 Tax=Agrobacterium vitis TaxID=373 RepID=UPI0015724E93|nr:hypothetical protein [Agrobacterium vitis]NSZ16777.1 hypothetical protein [Agrobacterium vitis]UJL87671.1 hypothetical protein AVF2S5_06840 [Agrobacterium vitis]
MISFSCRLPLILAASLLAASAGPGMAEDAFKSFKQLDSTAKMPKLNAFSTPIAPAPQSHSKLIRFEAKLDNDGQPLQQGLEWRVYSPIAGSDGKLPMVASSQGGSAELQLAPGDYFINVSFGRAGVTRKLDVPTDGEVQKQVMVLDAGGMVLNAVSGPDTRIKPSKLKFKIYAGDGPEDNDRGLIMDNIEPNTLVSLNSGTYHVVSQYGEVNALVRADIKVEAGKITEATLQHRAAQMNFKLVSEPGGEAIADTAWSILTSSGDAVAESVSAYPVLVLSEGNYTAIARNKDRIYQKEFQVKAGVNADVELLLKDSQQNVQQQAGYDTN